MCVVASQYILKNMKSCEFIDKLENIMKEYPDHLHWEKDSHQLRMDNLDGFQRTVLHNYFRHSNFSSFIRQLNMYGFCKKEKTSKYLVFEHPIFRRGNQSNFYQIVRKSKIRCLKKSADDFKIRHAPLLSKLQANRTLSTPVRETMIQMLTYCSSMTQTMKSAKSQLNYLVLELKDTRSAKVNNILQEINRTVFGQLSNSIQKSKLIESEIQKYRNEENQPDEDSQCSLEVMVGQDNVKPEPEQLELGKQYKNLIDMNCDLFGYP